MTETYTKRNTVIFHLMRNAWKGTLFNLRTTQAQISLRISAGWSGPSLSAYRISGYSSIYRTENAWIRLRRYTRWSESTCPQVAYGLFSFVANVWYELQRQKTYIWTCASSEDANQPSITKTRLFKYIENFTTKKGNFSDKKNSDIFYIPAQNIDCGYPLEPPRRGGSNEYPQTLFFSKIRKIVYTPVNPSFTIKVGFKGVKII